MLRSLLLLLVAAPLTAAAPPPKDAQKVELYFPTKVGTEWVLETKSGGRTTELTTWVTKAEEKDGVFRVTTAPKPADAEFPVQPPTYRVSAEGVSIVARGGKDWAVPQTLLKLPAKKGDTWAFDPFATANRPAGVAAKTTTYTVGAEVEVEVPAGKFKAVRVEMKHVEAGNGFTATQWYAPGVGCVKVVMKTGDHEGVDVLKSFTPGK